RLVRERPNGLQRPGQRAGRDREPLDRLQHRASSAHDVIRSASRHAGSSDVHSGRLRRESLRALGVPAAVSMLLALLVAMQGSAPLRKSVLVGLLSGAMLSSNELVELVSRNCLTFDPTARDRNDLRMLGADAAMLAAVEGCARRAAARRTVAVAPPVRRAPSAPPATPPPPPPRPPPPPAPAAARQSFRAAIERSGFVSGGGQRGTAGTQLPRAVVFEVRDSAGAPLPAQTVVFTGINARTLLATAATDATGQVRVGVTLGERAGPATVIASIGVVEQQG